MRPEACLTMLYLLLVSSLPLTRSVIDCNYDSDYLVEMSGDLHLQEECQYNSSTIQWAVDEPTISSNGEIFINYECSLGDTVVVPITRLKRISLGRDYKDFMDGVAVHPAPNVSLGHQQQLVCQYSGCFRDTVDGFVHLFDPVQCTFSSEPEQTTPSPAFMSPANVSMSSTATLSPSPSSIVVATLSPSPSSTLISSNSSSTIISSNSSSTIISSNSSSRAAPPLTLASNTSTRSAVQTPSPPSLTLSGTERVTGSVLRATAAGTTTSYFQEATLSTSILPTNSSSVMQSNNGGVLVSALVVTLVTLVTVGGVLIALALATHCNRRRREYKHPLKVIPGINDDLKIDPDFSPVTEAGPLSCSPSTGSVATILDQFSHPQAHSMTSLQLHYLYGGLTDWFNSESGMSVGERARVSDSSEYVQLYTEDSSGFTDHSYFSVSLQENSARDKVSTEYSHKSASTQLAEKQKDCCIDLLDANSNCQNVSIELVS